MASRQAYFHAISIISINATCIYIVRVWVPTYIPFAPHCMINWILMTSYCGKCSRYNDIYSWYNHNLGITIVRNIFCETSAFSNNIYQPKLRQICLELREFSLPIQVFFYVSEWKWRKISFNRNSVFGRCAKKTSR